MLHCEGPGGASRQRMKTDVQLTPAAAPLQQKGVAGDYSSWMVLSGLRVLSQGSEWPHRRRMSPFLESWCLPPGDGSPSLTSSQVTRWPQVLRFLGTHQTHLR